MSLTEQDREILLQEIKQIQQTLELSGRNIHSYDDGNSSDCESEVGNEIESRNWNPVIEDETDQNKIHFKNDGVNLREQKNVLFSPETRGDATPTIQSPFTPGVSDISGGSILLDKFLQTYKDPISPFGSEVSSAPFSPAIDKAHTTSSVGEENVPSSLSKKLKTRLKRESSLDLSSNSKQPIKKKKRTVDLNFMTKSDDGISTIDVSFPPSLASLPEQQKDKINMTNLYVERIFRGYRKNKHKRTPSVAFQGKRFDSKHLKSSANLGTLENLLQVNRQYQEVLLEELKKVEIALSRNLKAQDELMISTGEKEDDMSAGLNRACIGRFLIPYFKDGDGCGPPDNEDTKEKKSNQIAGPFPKPSKAWKATETAGLEEGVYNNNLERRLEPLLLRLKKIDKDLRDKTKETDKPRNRKLRSNVLKEISEIKSTTHEEILKDSFDIDFFKISKNYLPTRDEFECRLQWFNVIHPSINQNPFTKDEDSRLIKLAKKNDNFQWELISKELGTKRTPIQCLQRYQRTLNKDMIKTTWDKEDDDKLKEAVRLYGNSWVRVADHLGNRTTDQCLHRWDKTLNPAIRRGKWTEEEDENLLAAVRKYGTKNWKMVRPEVPGRTDSQCRERFVASLDPTINWGPFTKEEDIKMMQVVKKYGTGKWAKVASEFPGRRDHQIWRRYKQLCAEDYHEYRKENLWKKNSVMSYFLHRDSEKRGYELKDLDVNYSPTINHSEARKIHYAKAKLSALNYTADEIKHELARMHFEGKFSTVIQRNTKKPRRRRQKDDNDVDTDEPVRKEKGFDDEIVNDVAQMISSVYDPKVELRSLNSEKLLPTWDILSVKRPENPGKRDRQSFMRKRSDLEESDLAFRCQVILQKYRRNKILRTEAHQELSFYEIDIQEKIEGENHKKVLLSTVMEIYEKIDDYDETVASVEKLMIEQDVLDVLLKKNSRVTAMSDGTSPFQQCDKITETQVKPKRPRKPTEDSSGSSVTKTKKRKSAIPRKVSLPHDKSRIEIINTEDEEEVEEDEGKGEGEDASVSPVTEPNEKNSNEATDQLKTFTLLLQALHVDTNGVMQSLPEHNSSSTSTASTNDIDKPFPKCYPLSPNVASLRGFRSLLLHRRKLSEIVQTKYSFQPLDRSYQETRPYVALRERFRSLFIWPAFLATFIPKYSPDNSTTHSLPHQGGPSIMGPLAHRLLKKPIMHVTQGQTVSSYLDERRRQTAKAMYRNPPSVNQFGIPNVHIPQPLNFHQSFRPPPNQILPPWERKPQALPSYRATFLPHLTSSTLIPAKTSKTLLSPKLLKFSTSSTSRAQSSSTTTKKSEISIHQTLQESPSTNKLDISLPNKPAKHLFNKSVIDIDNEPTSLMILKTKHGSSHSAGSESRRSDVKLFVETNKNSPSTFTEYLRQTEDQERNTTVPEAVFIPRNIKPAIDGLSLELLAETVISDAANEKLKSNKATCT